jgi:hypothetical protein
MVRVYFEDGAFPSKLRRLQSDGRIKLFKFPYDTEGTKKSHEVAKPSAAYPEDLHLPPEKIAFAPEEFDGSDKYDEIRNIIGDENRRDVLHVDSAYKSNCDCFFTPDKGDILSKKNALKDALGMHFFHHEDDWDEFMSFLERRELASS